MRAELVGRDEEMAVLTGSLVEALNGEPRIVVCEGEPGIGKTRLAHELVGVADRQGVLCTWGAAAEVAGVPPYWPWRQVLRQVAGSIDVKRIAVEHHLAAELEQLAPDLVVTTDAATMSGGSAEDRFRRFDAVVRLLRQVCMQTPLLVVFDDAHWADEASVLLLQHVTRTVSDERLLIVVNVRDTEGDDMLMSRVGRDPVTRRIRLRGLSAPSVQRQLASALGREVDEAEAVEVQVLTGGNPLFVGEVALAIAEQRPTARLRMVIRSLHSAITGRLRRLSPATVRLLEAAAVVGREFTVADVAAMLGQPVVHCLAGFDEAQAARLVADGDEPGAYRFVHGVVRDAIEQGLSASTRVRLHRLAAEAIEQGHGRRTGPHLFDLSRHWAIAAVEVIEVTPRSRSGKPAMRRCASWRTRKRRGCSARRWMSAVRS